MSKMARVAIFHTDHGAEWNRPWKNFADMGIKIIEQGKALEENAATEVEYKVFDIYHEDFPNLEEIKRRHDYIGIYITGSRYDSFDTTTPWINKLRTLLRTILTEDGYPPVAGVCFGHQMIASALNCQVSRNPLGLEIGVTPIFLNETGMALFGNSATTIHLSEVHFDAVTEIPEGYVNWGSTALCELQGFYKPSKVITFQGHPEFGREASQRVLDMIWANHPTAVEHLNHDKLKALNTSAANDGPFVARFIWKLFRSVI